MPPNTSPRAPLALGALGTTLVAWGTCHPEFSHGPSGWPNPLIDALGRAAVWPLDWIVIVVGVVLLCRAWWRLRPASPGNPDEARTTRRTLGVALLAWSAPLLLVPPVLSADAVLYADLGWILHSGANPYQVGLTGAGGPYAAQVDPLWAGHGVAYPPLALLLDRAVVALAGFHPYVGIIAMRLPAIASVAGLWWLLPRLAKTLGRPIGPALWLGVLNPLVVLHFIGGAHNDAPMVALAVAGIWVALARPGWLYSLVLGPAVIGVAMACKQQAGLAVVAAAGVPVAAALAALPLWPRLWLLARRTAVATLVALGVFAAISASSGLGLGWTRWLSLMGNTGTPAPFSIIGKLGTLAIGALGGDPSGFLAAVALASGVALLGALAWVLVHFADRPLAAVAWGSLAVSVLGQSMHPWYLPWSLVLFALVPLSARQHRGVVGFAVAFVVWNSIQTVVWHTMP